MKLINISDLSRTDIRNIWQLVEGELPAMHGTVAWSFEGNGVRTRTTFMQAFRDLKLNCIELPNLLKSRERPCDLAGYLDPFYDLYVVREANHARLEEFAAASTRPVINAMSTGGHPCEVLTDAYFIDQRLGPIEAVRIGLWGPTTNVFRSWRQLAIALGFKLVHFCDPSWHRPTSHVEYRSQADTSVDILITDSWPGNTDHPDWSLQPKHLARMGTPRLLPTPPFFIGQELALDPNTYAGFVGYKQKELLLPVHKAILAYVAGRSPALVNPVKPSLPERRAPSGYDPQTQW